MYKFFVALCVLGTLFFLPACQSSDSSEDSLAESEGEMAPLPGITMDPASGAPAGTVFHYVCPKGCEGGGGPAQGACPVCGTALSHNQEWHNQPGATQDVTPPPVQDLTVPPPTLGSKEPAQNAKGVWHYVCTAGCAGGSGAMGPCAKCGKELIHNTVYHQ
jgi:hypothetical protein